MPRQFTFKKQCNFCKRKIDVIDYKDSNLLLRYLTSWGKMKSGHDTGTCSKHQRRLAEALKRARFLGLLPLLSIIVIMIGYFILIKGLYIIGGVYNPVNPGQDRPPE